MGGMASILNAFEVSSLFVAPKAEDSEEYNTMIQAATRQNVPVEVPDILAEYTLGNGVFTILAPGEEAIAKGTDNDVSLVLRYEYGERSFLMMGDALGVTEKEMRDLGVDLQSDVLKVGHHGKKDATKKKFVSVVMPTYAVITCGDIVGVDEDGMPDDEVITILENHNANIYRTDKDGTIIFDTNGVELTLR